MLAPFRALMWNLAAGQRLKPGGEEARGPPFVIRARLGVWHRADIIETDRYIPGANAQD